MEPEESFEEGEKCLAFDSLGTLYEAKIIAVKQESGKKLYTVHYLGWGPRWDETIDRSRLLKPTEQNMQNVKPRVARGRKPNAKGDKEDEEAAGDDRPDDDNNNNNNNNNKDKDDNKAAAKKRRLAEDAAAAAGVAVSDDFQKRVVVELPLSLERHLVEDWRNINVAGYLVNIPSRPSVHDLMRQYVADLSASGDRSEGELQVTREVVQGLQECFDKMLGGWLLYRAERPQYLDILESFPGVRASLLYGSEHFLRFLTRLPDAFSSLKLRTHEFLVFNSHLVSIVRYLARRSPNLFGKANYINQPPEYQRMLG